MSIDNSTAADRTQIPASQSNFQRISARELHGYVWGIMTVFIAFAISSPIACWRVSQSEQFRTDRSHVKSLTMLTSESVRN